MAFKDIFNLFQKQNPRRERLAGMLGKESTNLEKNTRPVPILDDYFEESSTGVFAQIKKSPFLNIAEFIETQRTSFDKHSIFVIEIFDDVVNAAIVSRKGVFLDIGFLKNYTYEQLQEIYFKIVPDSQEEIEEIKNSVENIVSIIAYDVVYTLPKKIVIIESNNSDMKEVRVSTGRFANQENLHDLMMRELSIETGLNEDEIEHSIIQKPLKKGDREINFLVSWVDKEYFQSVNSYVQEAGFELKKIHSLQSSLYSSFELNGRSAILRVHVEDNIAYTLYKSKEEEFQYQNYNITEMYEDLEFSASQAEEIILSGSGDYYEMLKSSFIEAHLPVRWWNYEYDLSRSIIRLEEGVVLDNRYANIMATAYYELFNVRLAVARLGVGTKLSFYELVALNLNLLPIMVIVISILAVMGWYFFEQMRIAKLETTNKQYSAYFKEEKAIKHEISVQNKNIKSTTQKIKKINDILERKVSIQDAKILYEITMKLPDDMIITSIKKIQRATKKRRKTVEVIEIKGRCYLENSLLKYTKNLKIKDKTLYLVEVKDSLETRFKSNSESNIHYINEQLESANTLQSGVQDSTTAMPFDLMAVAGSSVKYSDTLNNSFTLEIR